jgi:low temperature requirement protein LtrA
VLWVWANTTFYANRFDPDDLIHRLLVALQMVAICALAVSVHDAFGDMATSFALSYAAARATLMAMYARVYRSEPDLRPLVSRYIKGQSLVTAIWLISAVAPQPAAFYLWGIALGVDIATAIYVQRRQVLTPIDREHLPERFGLFVIIVLGEAVVGVVGGLADQDLDTSATVGSLFAMAIAFSVWWLYFDEPHPIAIERLQPAVQVWIYAHLPLAMAIAATGVAIEHILAADEVQSADRWLLCGAIATIFTASGVIHLTTLPDRCHIFRHVSGWYRVGAAAFLLATSAFAGGLDPPVLLAIVSAICVSQIVLDVTFDVHEQRNESREGGRSIP